MASNAARGWFVRKSIEDLLEDARNHPLRRSLGALQLTMIGIGAIIGAGIFVLSGNAAADFAGPAVLISFVLAGFACTFAALCYAELASTLPAAGSAYSYSYCILGEVPAWIMGWLMVLEFGTAVALISVGFAGYVRSALGDIGVMLPPPGAVNIIAAAGVLLVTAALLRGVSFSARINAGLVVLKVGVLLSFVLIGMWWFDSSNWQPFIPPNEGGFHYGWQGILRAAPMIFYAYMGFESVSTAAAEARNPQRDLPIGILSALFVCTLLYVAVAAVLTGVVPFRQLGVPDPIAVAVNVMGLGWFGIIMKGGAILGLLSVMMMTLYGQTRVFYAMARDGLLPPVFSRIHEHHRVPYVGTIITGLLIALIGALLPIDVLADLISLGTACAFTIVCISVIRLRSLAPDLVRPFSVPLGGVWLRGTWFGTVPTLGIFFCMFMVVPLLADLVVKALAGNLLPAALLFGYITIGIGIYLVYGVRHSKLRRAG